MEPRASTLDGPPSSDAARESILSDYGTEAPPRDRYWLHLLLFALTLASTVYAWSNWAGRWLLYEQEGLAAFVLDGLRFGGSLLLFLTVHEFGHYFAARHHRVNTSLPYYIPFPFNGIGTFGALIRIREPVPSLRKLFDIGAAGPVAGFVMALGVLLYALVTLPPPSYIEALPGHEALKAYIQTYNRFPDELLATASQGPGTTLMVGNTLLYWGLTQFFADVPPMYEIYHYPVLFAGWLGLFFTALNLLPIGQLDGGHILYALFGRKWHSRLARGFTMLLLVSAAIGFTEDVPPMLYAYADWAGNLSWFILAAVLYVFLNRVFAGDHRLTAPTLLGIIFIAVMAQYIGPAALQFGYTGWFVFGALIVFLVRVDHPPVLYHEPLTPGRRALGYFSILAFILCFSLKPLYFV